MLKNKKNIAILGSTGSIGKQALNIIASKPENFDVFLLSCNANYKLIYKQAKKFNPKYVSINTNEGYKFLKKNLNSSITSVFFGMEDLCDLMISLKIDLVLSGIMGSAGLLPTISAISAKKNVALANKESLVVAGKLIMNLAKQHGVSIIPVDSEHSAIFQCLVGEDPNSVNKLILTGSGGPFLNLQKKKNLKISP